MYHCQNQSCGCSSKNSCSCHSQSCCGGSCSCHKSCGCTSCGSACSCKKEGCGCGCKQCGCNYAQKFLELADCAWMELLKEKIKEHIQANAKNMDELARMIAEANHERWKKKMECNQCSGGFENKLSEFFGQSCPTHKK